MATDTDIFFNDTWKLFFHDPSDSDWTMESYVALGVISNTDDFWAATNTIAPHIASGMFFLMREHVFPCWDDTYNIDGGCYSVRVPRANARDAMIDMMIATLGETLLSEEHRSKWDMINGISISPKNAFNVIKIWMGKGDPVDYEHLWLPASRTKDVLYTKFRDQISGSSNRKAPRPPYPRAGCN